MAELPERSGWWNFAPLARRFRWGTHQPLVSPTVQPVITVGDARTSAAPLFTPSAAYGSIILPSAAASPPGIRVRANAPGGCMVWGAVSVPTSAIFPLVVHQIQETGAAWGGPAGTDPGALTTPQPGNVNPWPNVYGGPETGDLEHTVEVGNFSNAVSATGSGPTWYVSYEFTHYLPGSHELRIINTTATQPIYFALKLVDCLAAPTS